ncbi:MAG: hypothetical protein DLM61_12150 [Pseudonocardiales bacterium]|nr:MAG: hypothetical protein DLM61_12150 [Pseudonocardiales bacterium]
MHRAPPSCYASAPEHILTELTTVFEAIVTTSTPRSALNWLRKGPPTHDYWPNWPPAATRHPPADAHPHRRAVDYLREILMANHTCPHATRRWRAPNTSLPTPSPASTMTPIAA